MCANECTAEDYGTVTVDDNADCTITTEPSDVAQYTTASSSVPDAGAEASYVWKVIEGPIEIMDGQGTRSITWYAGAAEEGPAIIEVTVTDGSGCQCTNSVEVTISFPIE